jgi:hypothetical protein
MKIKSASCLFLSVFAFLLPGCTSYRITAARGDYDKVKHVWEYCKKCLTEEDCPERASCEENTPENINYAMDRALAGGRLDTVRYFVEEIGFDVDTPLDKYQSTALHRCATFRALKGLQGHAICRYLVSKGANVNAIALPNARTPLLRSIQKHNNVNAIFLLSNGADPSIRSSSGSDACDFAFNYENSGIMPYLEGCCERYSDVCIKVVKNEELDRIIKQLLELQNLELQNY